MPLLDRDGIVAFYERSRHELAQHGLWFLGGEPNTQPPEQFATARLRFLVARLSTYRDTASSITHGLLAQIARDVPGLYTDYAWMPPPKDLVRFERAGVPAWTATTSKQPPARFDVIGISNSIAQELLNLPRLLRASGLPLWKEERLRDESVPILLLGGNNSAAAAVVHGDAQGGDTGGLVDAVLVGEAEEALPRFLEVVLEGKQQGRGKREILERCHGVVPGFYEPDRYRYVYAPAGRGARLERIEPKDERVEFPVKRALVHDLNKVRLNEEAPIPYDEDSAGRSALPIDMGCPAFCSFCREGWEVKPYRERSPENFVAGLKRAKALQGLHTADLMSYNFNMHTRFYDLLASTLGVVDAVTMKSQRFDILAEDPQMAGVQHAAGKSQFTCGLEGISERLRRFLHKNLTREQILEASRGIFEAKARELKLFLIATGREEQEDFEEWSELLAALLAVRGQRPTRILASLTPLLPMPNTPSQYLKSVPIVPETNPIVQEIKRICERQGVEFRTAIEGDESPVAQVLLLGDRRVTPVLVRAGLERGALFTDGVPGGLASFLHRELEAAGVDLESMLGEKDGSRVLPWQDIATGVPQSFLWQKYQEMVRDSETEYCLDRHTVRGKCFHCDACPTKAHVKALVRRDIAPPPHGETFERLKDVRREPLQRLFRVNVPRRLGAAPTRFLQAAVARALLLAEPALLERYLHPGPAFEPFGRGSFLYGERVFALAFRRDTPLELLERAILGAPAHLQDLELLEAGELGSELLEPRTVSLVARPVHARQRQELRAAAAAGLAAARVKHTERRDERGRRFELHGANKLGVRELLVDELEGALHLTLDVRDEMRPTLAALLPKGPVELELVDQIGVRPLLDRRITR